LIHLLEDKRQELMSLSARAEIRVTVALSYDRELNPEVSVSSIELPPLLLALLGEIGGELDIDVSI
jgi:hypothetical protein